MNIVRLAPAENGVKRESMTGNASASTTVGERVSAEEAERSMLGPVAARAYPIWVAMGAAFFGTVMGGLAVYVGMQGQQGPIGEAMEMRAPEDPVVPEVEAREALAAALAEIPPPLTDAERLVQAVADVRDSVVSLKIGDGVSGAGVIFDERGLVFTNYHVIEPMLRASMLGTGGVRRPAKVVARFPNGRELPGLIVAADRSEDIAVLRLEPADSAETFVAAPVGVSGELAVGETVFAIGSPVGLEHTVSTGIVSAVDRTDILANRELPLIQLDASINLGNSGGPVFNLAGELVGITTARSARAEGIGFAIPIDRVRAFLAAMEGGDASRSGVVGVVMDPRKEPGIAMGNAGYETGVVIATVPEGPAKRAGMKVGDVLVEIRGKRFDELGSGLDARAEFARRFGKTVRSVIPGEHLEVTVLRGEERVEIDIEVEAASDERQTRIDVEELLGLRLDEDRDEPIVTGIDPTSRIGRIRHAEVLVGQRITKLLGHDVENLRELGKVTASLRAWARNGRERDVAISFRDTEGRTVDLQGFPLTVRR